MVMVVVVVMVVMVMVVVMVVAGGRGVPALRSLPTRILALSGGRERLYGGAATCAARSCARWSVRDNGGFISFTEAFFASLGLG